MSLRLGGHPQFVRPLINPMAQGAAISKYGEIDEEDEEKIKAQAAAWITTVISLDKMYL